MPSTAICRSWCGQASPVAICEQLEDPKLTKKLVKRGIIELVTPV